MNKMVYFEPCGKNCKYWQPCGSDKCKNCKHFIMNYKVPWYFKPIDKLVDYFTRERDYFEEVNE